MTKALREPFSANTWDAPTTSLRAYRFERGGLQYSAQRFGAVRGRWHLRQDCSAARRHDWGGMASHADSYRIIFWPPRAAGLVNSMSENRELTMDDYLAMLRRRLKVILIPALLAPLAGFLVSYALPAEIYLAVHGAGGRPEGARQLRHSRSSPPILPSACRLSASRF